MITRERTEDECAVDALVREFYEVFTNRDGRRPRLERLLDLVARDGILVRAVGADPEMDDLARFIAPRERMLNDGTIRDFAEHEVEGRTTFFGNIAQRLSLYEKSGVRDGVGFRTRGVKAMTFARSSRGWRIVAVAWDDERPGSPPPERLDRL